MLPRHRCVQPEKYGVNKIFRHSTNEKHVLGKYIPRNQ